MWTSVAAAIGAATMAIPLHAEAVPRCADRAGVMPAADGAGGVFAPAGRALWQRLDRLPPAAEILTVFRTVDGCPTPVVVRYGIGAAAKRGR